MGSGTVNGTLARFDAEFTAAAALKGVAGNGMKGRSVETDHTLFDPSGTRNRSAQFRIGPTQACLDYLPIEQSDLLGPSPFGTNAGTEQEL